MEVHVTTHAAVITHGDLATGKGGNDLNYIAVSSNHGGRPNTKSLLKYGGTASVDKPWELRLKYVASQRPFRMLVTSVSPPNEEFPYAWTLEGTYETSKGMIKGKLIWGAGSGLGCLYKDELGE